MCREAQTFDTKISSKTTCLNHVTHVRHVNLHVVLNVVIWAEEVQGRTSWDETQARHI